MTKKWLVALLSTAALTVSTGALAQAQSMASVPNFYIGADVGQTDTDIGDDTGFKIYGGYLFKRNIAAERGYGKLVD